MSTQPPQSTTSQGHGPVLATLVCWSSNFPTIRFVLRAYDALAMSALRITIGALALVVVALVWRIPLPRVRDWPLFALFGFTGVAGATVLLNLGLEHVAAGAGAFLIGTVPVFSALLALALPGERMTRRAWLGIGISLGGGLTALLGVWLVNSGRR